MSRALGASTPHVAERVGSCSGLGRDGTGMSSPGRGRGGAASEMDLQRNFPSFHLKCDPQPPRLAPWAGHLAGNWTFRTFLPPVPRARGLLLHRCPALSFAAPLPLTPRAPLQPRRRPQQGFALDLGLTVGELGLRMLPSRGTSWEPPESSL